MSEPGQTATWRRRPGMTASRHQRTSGKRVRRGLTVRIGLQKGSSPERAETRGGSKDDGFRYRSTHPTGSKLVVDADAGDASVYLRAGRRRVGEPQRAGATKSRQHRGAGGAEPVGDGPEVVVEILALHAPAWSKHPLQAATHRPPGAHRCGRTGGAPGGAQTNSRIGVI